MTVNGSLRPLAWPEIALPLARAEDALARLDERLRTSPIREGWIARTHFTDAAAALWIEGQLVHIEDLVLHDALAHNSLLQGAVLSGARSLPVGIAAEVTAAGGHVAVVGLPDFGLLAAAEMGADLSRLAVIPEPGTDPVEVAAVLMDGMDLVVLGLAGRCVSATRARAVVARARQRGCTLLVTQGQWQGASMRMDARVCGYEITSGPGGSIGVPVAGHGRISAVRVSIRTQGRR
jgi:hypothetical protein